MRALRLLFCCFYVVCAVACVSNTKRIEDALYAGNLKEAEMYLKKIDNASECRYYGGMLIDEYLEIGELNKAINVFDRITGHCSMYEMQYESLYPAAEYTRTCAAKIYDALLKAGRYEEAWNYHARSYDTVDYPGNAPDYFAYMVDCITHMCSKGDRALASQFMKQKSGWFMKNVDNHRWGEDYPQFRYDIMCGELNKALNNNQY